MTDKQPEALRMADELESCGCLADEAIYDNAAAELRRLHTVEQQRDELAARIAKDDRVLRSSVPERWKGCTSPVGAAQSYIAELESDRDELLAALKNTRAALFYQIDGKHGPKVASEYREIVEANAAISLVEATQ